MNTKYGPGHLELESAAFLIKKAVRPRAWKRDTVVTFYTSSCPTKPDTTYFTRSGKAHRPGTRYCCHFLHLILSHEARYYVFYTVR